MSQKEIWFVCPTCARPIRVAGKFIGAEFVHPPCGSTVRAPDPAKGRPDVELIAAPEINQDGAIKAGDIDRPDRRERHGLFVPRRLREGGGSIGGDGAGKEGGEDVQALAEKIAKALLEKGGKEKFLDLHDDDGGGGDEVVLDDEEVAYNPDPIREKASRMGFGGGPVDTEALRKQFNKSFDEFEDDGEAQDDDALAARPGLMGEAERQVVRSVTPWEVDDDDGGTAGAARHTVAPAVGGRGVVLTIGIAILVLGAVVMISKMLSGGGKKENPLDQPIRSSPGGR